jgi:hypothetical protein
MMIKQSHSFVNIPFLETKLSVLRLFIITTSVSHPIAFVSFYLSLVRLLARQQQLNLPNVLIKHMSEEKSTHRVRSSCMRCNIGMTLFAICVHE